MAGATTVALGLIQLLLLRILNTYWWRQPLIRYSSLALLFFAVLTSSIWVLAVWQRDGDLARLAAIGAAPVILFSLVLSATLPLSGIINTVYLWINRRRERLGSEPLELHSPQRRLLLSGLAAALPISALGLAGTGMARSFASPDVREIEFHYPGLAEDLDGFRILHVSDCHLGPYVGLDEIEVLIAKATGFSPDLVVLSGDIADDLSMLPDAIRLIESIQPEYGCFASMGNHEYYRGPSRVKNSFAGSSTPLLINEGVTLKVGNSDLYVGGADDPRYLGRPVDDFMRQTIDRTVKSAPSDSFKLIMSHRPSGFDRAAELGVELTLAGHTHGSQVGFMGRPLVNKWGNERYIRGKYTNDNSQLYVSAGVGHWFPFRLGCPTEAPILVLRKK
jgi:hypothetical protein